LSTIVVVPISQVIAALADSKPGEVLVIDTQDSTRTVGGELFATESQRRGLAALLIDGPVSVELSCCAQPTQLRVLRLDRGD
jgi:regulator of RNase E activity RraA